ncbi:MAG: glycoside hydrolase family 16 protein [Bacteroidales bacterium]|nr:glycoside hydrolase family 16 protein [Bacteroidales bacterium]
MGDTYSYDTLILQKTVNSHIRHYQCVFEDSFDGTELNTSLWKYSLPVPRDHDFFNQKAYHRPQNVKVEDGLLKIIIRREPHPFVGVYPIDWIDNVAINDSSIFEFTTGEIESLIRFPINCIVEARIKFPKSYGLNPAFWMYGQSGYAYYNEIDCAELFTHKQMLLANCYADKNFENKDGFPSQKCTEKIFYEDTLKKNINFPYTLLHELLNDYHIYRIIWSEDKIEIYIDDYCIQRFFKYRDIDDDSGLCINDLMAGKIVKIPSYYPSDTMCIVLNTAVEYGYDEGDIGVIDRRPNADFTSDTMFVDYVKVYALPECYSQDIISIGDNYSHNESLNYDLIQARTIILDTNVFLHDGRKLEIKANDEIIINAGASIRTQGNSEILLDIQRCKSNGE